MLDPRFSILDPQQCIFYISLFTPDQLNQVCSLDYDLVPPNSSLAKHTRLFCTLNIG